MQPDTQRSCAKPSAEESSGRRMTDKEDGKANRTRRTKDAKKGEQMRTDEEDN